MPPVPPSPPSLQLATFFKLNPVAGRRWPFAARAALCTGLPVLTGWLAGDTAAGLMATIGAFTVLYGSGRPYLSRAIHLAAIAVSFALAVMLGVWATGVPFLVVPAIVLVAMFSTFLCNALRTGPPGAYMFALACAAGTGIPVGHLSIAQVGLLVFAGGACAWLLHMAGALVRPRGPEKAATLGAAQALIRFAKAVGTPGEDGARHAAALALHQAWAILVTYQPAHPGPDSTLSHLRALNRELHLLFVGVLNTPRSDAAALAGVVDAAQAVVTRARGAAGQAGFTAPTHVPLGHLGLRESLRDGLRAWSPVVLATVRVGAATAIAGTIGAMLGLEHAYWAMAAAVLILHQGLDWVRSVQRGIARVAGTFIGLALAGGILALHPQGPWLVAILMVVQFTIEMTVVRNYALAVVFITAAALTIASGGLPVHHIGHLLWVRAEDTVIGCVTGLAILALTSPCFVEIRIPRELVGTLVALKRVLAHAAKGDVTCVAARRARRALQHQAIALLQAYEASVGATPWHRDAAERAWPTVSAAQRLVYRTLAVCWSLEESGGPGAAHQLFGPGGERDIGLALLELSNAIRAGAKPQPLPRLPEFLEAEMRNLHDSLVYAGADRIDA